jgi:hypothetical protein
MRLSKGAFPLRVITFWQQSRREKIVQGQRHQMPLLNLMFAAISQWFNQAVIPENRSCLKMLLPKRFPKDGLFSLLSAMHRGNWDILEQIPASEIMEQQ